MWLMVSFDIPSEKRKDYTSFRKLLVKNGFHSFQKSLCFRYVHSREKEETILRRLRKEQIAGEILCMRVPDHAFGTALNIKDGKEIKMPDIPEQWLLL